MSPDVLLVTAGDPDRPTGGNLYNHRILAALSRSGLSARVAVLPETGVRAGAAVLREAIFAHRPHVAVVDSIALIPASRVPPPAGTRFIALMHMLPSALASPWRRPRVAAAEGRLLRRSIAVVGVSQHLAERLLPMTQPGRPPLVIPPGRDGVHHERERVMTRSGAPRFLCVANWTPAKGIHVLLRAVQLMTGPVRLDLVGGLGAPTYSRRLHKLVQSLVPRVVVHGELTGEDLARRYASADVFVLPSLEEGYGTVVAEALDAGLPVVASDLGPVRQMVPHDAGLLVPPGDAEALARAMDAFAGDPARRRTAAHAALHAARALPTWAETEARFVSLIRSLLTVR